MSLKLKCEALVGFLNFISLFSSHILAWNSGVINQQNHSFKYLFFDAPNVWDYMINGGMTDE